MFTKPMSKAKRPLILVSNDDGITSRGIRLLTELMTDLGDVFVVAPDSPQSGMGHAITINDPLKFRQNDLFDGVEAYESSGTPADCIKLAKNFFLKPKGRVPDLVVSGVNHGSNASVSVLYSGTMSAAIEAAIEGMPAIGFSLCDYNHDAEMDHIRPYITAIAKEALEKGMPKGISLNVNFPAANQGEIKGMKVCRQASAKYVEEFDERIDPYGRRYLWLTGRFENHDKGKDTDIYAIKQGYVSIVPVSHDMTAHHAVPILNKEWDFLGE